MFVYASSLPCCAASVASLPLAGAAQVSMTVLCAHAEARIQAQVSAEQQLGRAIRIAEHMPCGAQIFVPRVLCLIAHDFQARKMYVCVCCICVCVVSARCVPRLAHRSRSGSSTLMASTPKRSVCSSSFARSKAAGCSDTCAMDAALCAVRWVVRTPTARVEVSPEDL